MRGIYLFEINFHVRVKKLWAYIEWDLPPSHSMWYARISINPRLNDHHNTNNHFVDNISDNPYTIYNSLDQAPYSELLPKGAKWSCFALSLSLVVNNAMRKLSLIAIRDKNETREEEKKRERTKSPYMFGRFMSIAEKCAHTVNVCLWFTCS